MLFYLVISHAVLAAKYRTSHRNRRAFTKLATDNKWYQLITGLVMGVMGISSNSQVASYNKCLPDGLQVTNQNADDDKSPNKNAGWITTVLDFLEKVLKFVCKFKDKIASLLGGLLRRNFMEKRMGRVSRKGVFDKIKGGFDKLKDWASATWDKVKSFGKELADSIKDFFKDLKNKIIAYFPDGFQAYINKFVDCGGVAKAKEVLGNAVSVIKGIINKVQKIARAANGDAVALASIIIDIICNFPLFRQGWDHFKTAWGSSEILTKYNYYGRAFGVWFKAIATRRLNRLVK